jgi:hypothetical protein
MAGYWVYGHELSLSVKSWELLVWLASKGGLSSMELLTSPVTTYGWLHMCVCDLWLHVISLVIR